MISRQHYSPSGVPTKKLLTLHPEDHNFQESIKFNWTELDYMFLDNSNWNGSILASHDQQIDVLKIKDINELAH